MPGLNVKLTCDRLVIFRVHINLDCGFCWPVYREHGIWSCWAVPKLHGMQPDGDNHQLIEFVHYLIGRPAFCMHV